MNEVSSRLRASLWWLVPLLALAALVGWETDWGRELQPPLPAPEAITPKPVVAALMPEYEIAGGVAARQETVERTLFNPTRRPAPPVNQEGAVPRLQRGQFALTGTMIVDGKNTAFLREVTGNRSRRVQQGESINGLLVAEVRPDRVKLTMGDESEELVLKVAGNPRPTPQPQPVAAQGVPLAAPGAVQAAAPPPAPAGAQESPQTLAERRRAARAAQAGAGGAATLDGAPAPPPMTAPPVTPATPNAAAAAAPTTPDPKWQEVYRRYQQQQR
jgi:hypothetical protein